MNYEQTDEDIWAATTHFPDYWNFSLSSIEDSKELFA